MLGVVTAQTCVPAPCFVCGRSIRVLKLSICSSFEMDPLTSPSLIDTLKSQSQNWHVLKLESANRKFCCEVRRKNHQTIATQKKTENLLVQNGCFFRVLSVFARGHLVAGSWLSLDCAGQFYAGPVFRFDICSMTTDELSIFVIFV